MSRLWLVRHAPVAMHGICYGRADVASTMPPAVAADHVQRALRKALGSARVLTVFSSPASRCGCIARLIAAHYGVPLALDDRLAELSFGAWEGQLYATLAGREDFERWASNWWEVAPPGGESGQQLVTRVRLWLQDVSASMVEPDGAAVAFTHAGVLRAVRALYRGEPAALRFDEPVRELEPESFTLPLPPVRSTRAPGHGDHATALDT